MVNWVQIFRTGLSAVYVKPGTDSVLYQKYMSDDVIKLNFTQSEYIELNVGDFIVFSGVKYTINKQPRFEKLGANKFKYECKFEGPIHELDKVALMVDNLPVEIYTGTAADFLSLFVLNMNRDHVGYEVGNADSTEAKTITFDNDTVFSAINTVADEFGISFSIVNKTLHFQETGATLSYSFKVGVYQGLYNLFRKNIDNSNIITRLWAYGSDRNLPVGYRDYIGKLAFANAALNNKSCVENNVNKYGLCERTKDDFDIYPTRTGTVTGIDSGNVRLFTDIGMDFDLNDYLLSLLKPKINFKSGNLIGRTFECSYNNTTKTFTLDEVKDSGIPFPNETVKPEVGDTYTIYDIFLPQSYIDDAEARLKAAAEAYLSEYSIPRVTYELSIDPRYIREKGISLNIGDYIIVIDTHLGISGLVRVNELERSIYNLNMFNKIEVGTLQKSGKLQELSKKLNSTTKTITQKADTTIVNALNTRVENNRVVWQQV
ncbi:MAG: phage tail protein [Salinivirgaceae bacterium]